MRDGGDRRQGLAEEVAIGGHVPDPHLQEIVEAARNHVALQDLRPRKDRRSELLEGVRRRAVERHLHEGEEGSVQLLGRKQRAVAGDVAAPLQPSDPFQAGRRAEAHPSSEFDVG